MREEEEPSWFARWEEELPTPEELTPISQTLITPDLALAFDIPTSPTADPTRRHLLAPPRSTPPPPHHLLDPHPSTPSPQQHQPQQPADFDPLELGGAGDEPTRTLKRPRLVWTPQLHKRFVDAVAHLGIKNAVPKTIMQLMRVDGLTRENVASHLQKYRLYLKRMQGLSSSPADAATDRLFASAPVPPHLLNCGPPTPAATGGLAAGAEQFMPFVPVDALRHHQQMAVAAAAAHQSPSYYHHRHMGHLGSPPGGGFDHAGFLTRQQPQLGMHGLVGTAGEGVVLPLVGSYADDLDSRGGGRKVLTLFPTGED